MQQSQIPSKFPIPWANSAGSGFIRTIPAASQIGIQNGAASLTDGFPPLTFQAEQTGGVPMFGADVNGILNPVTAWNQWYSMGGPIYYDGTFSAEIGGYPKNAWILAAAANGWWLSLVDNNTSNPDAGGANWQFLSFGQTYAGNPNGNVAGVSTNQYGVAQALLWDTTNKILWLCTSSGPASGAGQAIWTQITGSTSGPTWCGTSGGTGNAPVLTPPNTLQTFGAGTGITWKVGANNAASVSITVGTFGFFTVKKGSTSGLLSLSGGELVSGNIVTGYYDGTNIVLTNWATGTAALANASSGTGTVAAVSGSTTVGHLAVFSDNTGTLQDGGAPGTAPAKTYINASANNTTLAPGDYIVDTNASGAFAVNMPATPTLGQNLTFADVSGTWNMSNFTLNGNGNSFISPSGLISTTLVCNRSAEEILAWWNGTYWSLY
jgi:hypothetical protein